MRPSVCCYSALQDGKMWKYVAAGAAGAVPAAFLWPVSLPVALAGIAVSGPVIAFLLLLPAVLLSLWAAVWWISALRRVIHLRRLTQTGVMVQARVQRHQLLRDRRGHLLGVVLWLEYDMHGSTYRVKKRTTLPGIAAQARDLERVDLAVDPQAPRIAALIAEGRLG